MDNFARCIIAGNVKYWESANGRLHRTDGPAVMYGYGLNNTSWYVNGSLCTTKEVYQERAKLSDEDMTMIILTYGKIE